MCPDWKTDPDLPGGIISSTDQVLKLKGNRLMDGVNRCKNRMVKAPARRWVCAGIVWDENKAMWKVYTKRIRGTESLGWFKNEDDAAKAFNDAIDDTSGQFWRDRAVLKIDYVPNYTYIEQYPGYEDKKRCYFEMCEERKRNGEHTRAP